MFFNSGVEALLPGSVYLMLLALVAAIVSSRRWLRWVLGGLVAWSWVLSAPVVANAWVARLEGPAPGAPAAAPRDERTLTVVLASGELSHRGGPLGARLDGPGLARLAAGVGRWRQTGGRLALVGGEPVEGATPPSLAAAMRAQVLEWGVPEDAIVVLPGSSRTQQDLLIAAPTIRANPGTVWLVTSAMHMPRALDVARHLGLAVEPHRCDYRQFTRLGWVAWLPNAGAPPVFADVLHEELGRLFYRWRGWS